MDIHTFNDLDDFAGSIGGEFPEAVQHRLAGSVSGVSTGSFVQQHLHRLWLPKHGRLVERGSMFTLVQRERERERFFDNKFLFIQIYSLTLY